MTIYSFEKKIVVNTTGYYLGLVAIDRLEQRTLSTEVQKLKELFFFFFIYFFFILFLCIVFVLDGN